MKLSPKVIILVLGVLLVSMTLLSIPLYWYSRVALEDELGETVEYFAYPYGRYNQEIQRMVEEAGYSLACSTRSGFNNVDADKYALRRIEVQGGDSVWKLKQKLNFGVNDVGVGFLLRYYLGRAKARVMV